MSDKRLRIGFIPLADATALIVAVDKGFCVAEGLDIELGKLGALCDRLEEVARQLRELWATARGLDAPEVREDLEVVQGSLSDFEREYELARRKRKIGKEKAQLPTGPDIRPLKTAA